MALDQQLSPNSHGLPPSGGAVRVGSGRWLLPAAGLLAVMFAFLGLFVWSTNGPLHLDQQVLTAVLAHRSSVGSVAVAALTMLGSSAAVAVLAVIVTGLLWWRRDRVGAVALLVLLLVASGLTLGLKHVVGRERPPVMSQVLPWETGYAFPSGHTLFAVMLWCGAAALLSGQVRRRAHRIVLVGCGTTVAVAVGASRIYLGYHWLTDVLGSFLLGSACVLVTVATVHRLKNGRLSG